MIISCGDDWLVYSHEEEIKDDEGAKVLSRDFPQKDWLGFMSTHPVDSPLFQSNDTNSYRSTGMYRDTRVQDRDAYMSHEKACHEAPNMRGYTWKNKITNKEETVYCPSSFLLWDGRHIADRQSSTFESMKGKTFKDVKEYAAAGTVLHETTHSEEVMGEYYSTEGETCQRSSAECQQDFFLAHIAFLDVRITYQGKVYAAYGGPLCRELAMTFSEEIGYPEKNAGRCLHHIIETQISKVLTGLKILWPFSHSGFIIASAIGLTLISPVGVGLTHQITFVQR